MSAPPKDAIAIVHWPGQSTPACEDHRDKLMGLADAMGMPRPSTSRPDYPMVCANCANEAAKKAMGDG